MQRLPSLRLLIIALALLHLAPTPTLFAQNDSGISMTVTAAFDGFYKSGQWYPLQIEVANSGASVEGELRFTVGNPQFNEDVTYAAPISLPTQSNKRVTLLINDTGTSERGDVELVDENGRVVFSQPVSGMRQLGANDLLYGVVSSAGGELAYLEDIRSGRFISAEVAFLSLEQLPETAVAWKSLDIIILNDVDSSQLSVAQLAALDDWLNSGGQLVVTGGNGFEKTVTAVSDLLPVAPTSSETVPDLPNFNQQIPEPFRDDGPYLVTNSILRTGELLYFDDELPILAVNEVGRGSVYFLAIDPRTAPLLDWNGTDALWRTVVNRISPAAAWHAPIQNNSAAINVAQRLPDLNLPSALTLFLFLLVYVLLIGPLNYIILRRRNQLDRAWISIPSFILVFSLGTYFVGAQIRGSTALLNELSVAVSQNQGETAEVQTLLGLYAPQRGSYQFGVANDVQLRPLRGPYDGFTSGFDSIEASSNNQVQGMRLDVGEVAAFATHSYQPAFRATGQASLESEGTDAQLTATIQNNSDQPMTDVSLLFGNQIFSIADLEPGASDEFSTTLSESTLARNGVGSGTATSISPGSSPLLNNLDIVIGGSNYYQDEELIRRRMLIDAISGSGNSNIPTDSVTLIFWTDQPQIEPQLNRNLETSSTTLHFIELPLELNLDFATSSVVPTSLLSWSVLESNNVFSPEPTNVSFGQNGSVAFEYMPLGDYQTMQVETLTLSIGEPDSFDTLPQVLLWNWQQEVWDEVENASWGDTAVSNPTPYIGTNNTIRIRLVDQTSFGIYIDNVYPIISGENEP